MVLLQIIDVSDTVLYDKSRNTKQEMHERVNHICTKSQAPFELINELLEVQKT